MKKILIASSLVVLASGNAMATGFTAGGTAGAVSNITTTNCSLLSTAVNVNLSSNNVGAYDCNANSGTIGVAVASTVGKNNVYSLGSAGGSITITSNGTAVPDSAACNTQAVNKSNSS